ncbi:hypothetical protein [Parvicella tangerina]|uniref:Uncharacterized protein n=1 Tax=Parvicella tangerina TaxID=2829795 RepID=A0A916NCG7_9FLAO|nr:hypothetical protein [Parvicella tangerina]CAG5083097.1 hypothetical protein CRYO30217_02087 [Parvicella tangerina]
MDNKELSKSDWEMITESLGYTKLRVGESQDYPDYESKQKKIHQIEALIAKVNEIKKRS